MDHPNEWPGRQVTAPPRTQLDIPPIATYPRTNTYQTARNVPSSSRQTLSPHMSPVISTPSSANQSPFSTPSPGAWSKNTLPPLHRANTYPDNRAIPHYDETQQRTSHRSERDEASDSSLMDEDERASQLVNLPERSEEGMDYANDFVKKLYKLIEDQAFSQAVAWGPQGDCFIVKDVTEFTRSVLPRTFKHANFASFVRQLNKYGFHKMKNTEDNDAVEQSWTFRHPDFHADRSGALENIKRKPPAQRRPQQAATSRSVPDAYLALSNRVDTLHAQVEQLTRTQEEMATHIRNMDEMLQYLVQYVSRVDNARSADTL